eukprot:m.43832 g.43832  ORF g.43832 m.43832 type:complete len:64 (-) comp12059_c1_seq1:15-206(-)
MIVLFTLAFFVLLYHPCLYLPRLDHLGRASLIVFVNRRRPLLGSISLVPSSPHSAVVEVLISS